MISDIRDKGYFIRSIIELSSVVPVNELNYVMIEYTKKKAKKSEYVITVSKLSMQRNLIRKNVWMSGIRY